MRACQASISKHSGRSSLVRGRSAISRADVAFATTGRNVSPLYVARGAVRFSIQIPADQVADEVRIAAAILAKLP